jgi:hypothetical protein
MKRHLFVLLAALLLATATAAPAAAADPARPFTGSWVSADGFDFAAPGCPPGTFLRFSTTGRTEFAHLGLTTLTSTHCTTVDPATLSGAFSQGVIILTAANGDTLRLAEEGTFTLTLNPAGAPPFAGALAQSHWTVTGGTGRFREATGWGTGTSTDNMLTGMQSFVLSGWIAY